MYFDWKKISFKSSTRDQRVAVIIVGAGPVGLAMAQGLARQGVRSIVLEARDQVSDGSRAIALTRRTMQVFDTLGVGIDVLAKAEVWDLNAVFLGNELVYEMRLTQPPCEKHKMTNLQQCWVEQIFLDHLAVGGFADVRFQSTVVGVTPNANGVDVQVRRPDGSVYGLQADYVIGADGARGATSRLVDLQYEGQRFEQRFVITDFHMKSNTEIGRRVWFSPPYARGTTVLQHRGPFDIWRLDYQLRASDDPEAEIKPERVRARVAAHLEMVGEKAPYEIIWTSIYRANALSLPTYQRGRLLFIGDAAHQIPIFGGRGINNGFMDVINLAWKLGYVIRGDAPESLLASYTRERRASILATIEDLSKVTIYMTTPSPAVALMRDAVLSLSLTERFVHTLFDPFRVPAYASLELEATASARAGDLAFDGGPAIGQVAPDVALQIPHDGADSRLFDRIDYSFACLAWGETAEPDQGVRQLFESLRQSELPIRCVAMSESGPFNATPGTVYLLRPDHHVAGRWKHASAPDVLASVRLAMAHQSTETQAEVSECAKNTPSVAKVEHDFQAICANLEGLSDREQALFLAKLALVLCDLTKDPHLVPEAIRRAKLNLDKVEI